MAALALAPFAWHGAPQVGSEPVSWRFLAVAGWGGLAFFLAAWLQQSGLETATVTNTGFLTALYVVITPFIAWGWSGKAPNLVVWPAVALSALGTWLLGGGTLGAFSPGDRLVALSAVLWAAHVVITGRAARSAGRSASRPCSSRSWRRSPLPARRCWRPRPPRGSPPLAIDIAYVGLLSSALTFTLLTVALQHTPPSEAAVIVSLETVFAALAAYLVLGERLGGLGLGRRGADPAGDSAASSSGPHWRHGCRRAEHLQTGMCTDGTRSAVPASPPVC